MVFRSRPRMTAEEGTYNRNRRHKLFVVFTVVCVSLIGYYLLSYSRENSDLINKQMKLIMQLKKYAAEYGDCQTSLRTSKTNVLDSHESNKQLQDKVAKQEQDIEDLSINSREAAMKLDGAYQFFVDVNGIVGSDQSISDDQHISPDAAVALKQEIQMLNSEHADFEKLKKSHEETINELNKLKKLHGDLTSRAAELKVYETKLSTKNKLLKRNLANKSTKSERGTPGTLRPGNPVQKLGNEKTYKASNASKNPALPKNVYKTSAVALVKQAETPERVKPQIREQVKHEDTTKKPTLTRKKRRKVRKNKAINPVIQPIANLTAKASTKPAIKHAIIIPTITIAAKRVKSLQTRKKMVATSRYGDE